MNKRTQIELLNCFHDGSIIKIINKVNHLSLKIEIKYLAQLLNPNFEYFYINLENCMIFSFDHWDMEDNIIDLQKISNIQPEILNCDTENDSNNILVYCATYPGPGGLLTIKTDKISIFDQNSTEIEIKTFYEIVNSYWKQTRGQNSR